MHKIRPYAVTATLFTIALLALPTIHGRRATVTQDNAPQGLQMRVSDGAKTDEPAKPSATPASQALDAKQKAALLRRMAPLKAQANDKLSFALRERSLPPPRTGRTQKEPFPARGTATAPSSQSGQTIAPLTITRVAPEGEIELAPHLSITFSQPMVALTAQDEAAQTVPVKLTPQPPGKWRWIGTQTLLFEPEGRFPMATHYEIEVPAGTRSALGGLLAESKRWTFSTPAPAVKTFYERSRQEKLDLNPLLLLAFNQRIRPAEVLPFIRLQDTAKTGTWAVRLATTDEINNAGYGDSERKAGDTQDWIALRVVAPADGNPEKPLPAATNFTLIIKAGMPSAEGPRTSIADWSHGFGTFEPFRIVRAGCARRESKQCAPYDALQIEFNNQPAYAPSLREHVSLEPAVADLNVSQGYNNINLRGTFRPRTTYRLTLKASLTDAFQQTLGHDQTVEITTSPASPALHVPGNGMAVLDPSAPRSFSIYSVNQESLRLKLYSVAVEEYARHLTRQALQQNPNAKKLLELLPPVGQLVWEKTINTKDQPDRVVETKIDLAPALNEGIGHALLVVEPALNFVTPRQSVWIQATELALDAFTDRQQMLAWVSSLKDGRPVADAELSLVTERLDGQRAEYKTIVSKAVTAADGMAKLALSNEQGNKFLIARKGRDAALLLDDRSSFYRNDYIDDVRWHVFNDRGLYRPGETVHVKGWFRRVTHSPFGDVALLKGTKQLHYVVKDAQGNDITEGKLMPNALGGFATSFKLPPTMHLGTTSVEFELDGEYSSIYGEKHTHQFQVQEFRRPEYEVNVTASAGPHLVGAHADLNVTASYYAGGGLADAPLRWHVNSRATNYVPPNRSTFSFGKWYAWWHYHEYSDYYGDGGESHEARTNAQGKHRLRVAFESLNPPNARLVTARASLTDVNRQNIMGMTQFIVHPAELYVGLRSPRAFVQPGEPLVVEAIVTDLDGKAVANRQIKMHAVRHEWHYSGGWSERALDTQECTVQSAAEAVKCSFVARGGGRYAITATIYDDRERRNESDFSLWVAGGQAKATTELTQDKVDLIPSQAEFKAGDTAELLVQAPFPNAEGVLTLRRDGLVTSERFTVKGTSHTLRIPIKDEYTPNLHVQVDLVGATARIDESGQPIFGAASRPAFASGTLKLAIPPVTRKLNVKAVPRTTTLMPGGATTVDVEVRDHLGKPVRGSEVAVIVVDEAVLALTRYQTPDGLKAIYQDREAGVNDQHLRAKVLLAQTESLIAKQLSSESKSANFLNASVSESVSISTDGASSDSIKMRRNFDALATFAAAVPTDANGRAVVAVKLPDNLTRYRVMAIAVAGARQFGSGESSITARLPLMARPSAPRFLNVGDRFELPVVIQNQTDAPLTVEVVVRATNAALDVVTTSVVSPRNLGTTKVVTTMTTSAGKRVTVPANNRVEIRFPAKTVSAGTARFQIAAQAAGRGSARFTDAAEIALPVWMPATTEAFATYGELDEGALTQPVSAPTDAFKEFGGLEVTTSSTQLQALTDAVIYVVNYPYGCAEQISSRVLAIAALRDVLTAFQTKDLPAPDALRAKVNGDLERLATMQNEDGAFGFWSPPDDREKVWPYLGIHAAHAMARAQAKGFTVPPLMLERSRKYLKNIEDSIPSVYTLEHKHVLRAYALYVRNLFGEPDEDEAKSLLADMGGVERSPLEALGWLLPLLKSDDETFAAIKRHLNNRVEETAGNAHFTTSYQDGAHLLLDSERRTDAILLEALIVTDAKNPLIAKIARGLLAHRKAGRWENTQENCWVLLALDRYFNTYEKTTPNFIARAWLGQTFAGEHTFKGRTTERSQINVPMQWLLARGGEQTLTLNKTGAGRMYYRLGMNYAPTDLRLKPADYGFTVTRTYAAIDNPDDVRRDADGVWHIRAGARVRVRLTMHAPARRYHVALVDPLPAGFEAVNRALDTTDETPRDIAEQTDGVARQWLNEYWYEHQNLRDERAEAFTSLLEAGVYVYSYVARATTPGTFIAPPPKAEEMYHPETFGRGATARVVIE